MIDRAGLLHFVSNQFFALIEKENAKFLPLGEGLRAAAMIEHGRPGRERRALFSARRAAGGEPPPARS
jgi:hypothetical protein